ncbi:MAG: PD40 domain-containing protein [Phycisphaerales bacterium]|nr:PD40 domain-containing protein [Phycisphaerales bacterium]
MMRQPTPISDTLRHATAGRPASGGSSHNCFLRRLRVLHLSGTVLLLALAAVPAVAEPPASADSAGAKEAAAHDESKWIRNVRQLTRADMGLARSGEAYFSADGKRVAFQAYPTDRSEYQIYIMNVDGSGLKMISTGVGATTCAYFSPDGKRVLFAANHLDPRPVAPPGATQPAGKRSYSWSFYPGMDLFEYTLDGGDLRRLTTEPGYDAEGSFSPDGKLIVFTTMRGDDQDIWICNADGTEPRPVVTARGYDGGPFFSPDGKRIVYRSDRRGDETMQIFVNTLDGKNERAITSHDTLHWCPFWHPSGRWIIYTRGDHGGGPPRYDLYLVSDDGRESHRVTSDAAFDGLPVFSADGKQLMWTSRRGGLSSPQVFVADFVGLTPDGALTGKAEKSSAEAPEAKGQ